MDVDLDKVYFSNFLKLPIKGVPGCFLTRTGYTGEDGFELSIPNGSVSRHSLCWIGGALGWQEGVRRHRWL